MGRWNRKYGKDMALAGYNMAFGSRLGSRSQLGSRLCFSCFAALRTRPCINGGDDNGATKTNSFILIIRVALRLSLYSMLQMRLQNRSRTSTVHVNLPS